MYLVEAFEGLLLLFLLLWFPLFFFLFCMYLPTYLRTYQVNSASLGWFRTRTFERKEIKPSLRSTPQTRGGRGRSKTRKSKNPKKGPLTNKRSKYAWLWFGGSRILELATFPRGAPGRVPRGNIPSLEGTNRGPGKEGRGERESATFSGGGGKRRRRDPRRYPTGSMWPLQFRFLQLFVFFPVSESLLFYIPG